MLIMCRLPVASFELAGRGRRGCAVGGSGVSIAAKPVAERWALRAVDGQS